MKKERFLDTLVPDAYLAVEKTIEVENKFAILNKLSAVDATSYKLKDSQMSEHRHIAYFTSLSKNKINYISELIINDNDNDKLKYNPKLEEIITNIITPEIDSEIKSYFGSHYAIMSIDKRTITSESRHSNVSTKWHCDVSPIKSLMLMCYLNDDSEHSSSTLFLTPKTTKKLKEVGYIYSNKDDRLEDIDDLLDYYDLDKSVERHCFKTGESIVFAAAKIAHKAQIPREGTQRSTIDIAIIPSPVPWKEALRKKFKPHDSNAHCFGEVERLLSAINTTKNDNTGYNVIKISQKGDINSEHSLNFHLNSIFNKTSFSQSLSDQLNKININFVTLTIHELLTYLKKQFRDNINFGNSLNIEDIDNLTDLLSYEKNFSRSILRYSTHLKPERAEFMWPIPNHEKYPNCKFDMLPYVQQHKIMDKSTPIGSAGSCFAVEIAEILQKEKFNYVITELGDSPDKEAMIDGYE